MLTTDKLKDVRAIGYNIAQILKKKEMTAVQLAVLLSCPEMHIQEILTGSIEPDRKELDIIARFLEVTLDEILQEPDGEIMDYNVHYMGQVSDIDAMNETLDEVDLYVRLLNLQ